VRPGLCEVCPPGTYSFDNSSARCLDCPADALCPGGDVMMSTEGFWQSSAFSNQIHR